MRRCWHCIAVCYTMLCKIMLYYVITSCPILSDIMWYYIMLRNFACTSARRSPPVAPGPLRNSARISWRVAPRCTPRSSCRPIERGEMGLFFNVCIHIYIYILHTDIVYICTHIRIDRHAHIYIYIYMHTYACTYVDVYKLR